MTDLTLNHTGDHHEWFTAAQANADSVEASGTTSSSTLTSMRPGSMCRLCQSSIIGASHFINGSTTSPDSVSARYLQPPFNMSGWRIDVANMTGRLGMLDLNQEVAQIARRTMEDIDSDLWLVGEHFHDAIRDTPGDGWHGVMNYGGVSRPSVSWLGKSEQLVSMTPGPGITARNGVQIAQTMDAVRGGLPFCGRPETNGSSSAPHEHPHRRSLWTRNCLVVVNS